MGKRFITSRDIDELLAAGKRELPVDADTVVTDVARERALERGIRLVRTGDFAQTEALPHSRQRDRTAEERKQLAAAVKKAVVAHLGSAPEGLDRIIAGAIK